MEHPYLSHGVKDVDMAIAKLTNDNYLSLSRSILKLRARFYLQ